MLDFRIYPPLVVKDTPKPRALGSLAEVGHFVEHAMRLRRPPPWRNIYERLRAVGNEEEAIEVIGALRELLDLEDLLVPPKAFTAREVLIAEPTEDAEPLKGAGGLVHRVRRMRDDKGCDGASRRERGRRGAPLCGQQHRRPL
ncbi:MAG: hypothetical protein ACXU8R_19360 [Xanthobacteraceae bacterium]